MLRIDRRAFSWRKYFILQPPDERYMGKPVCV